MGIEDNTNFPINMKNLLLEALDQIGTELQNGGKIEPSMFFINARKKIASKPEISRSELVDLLSILETSGAITQYANFNCKEEFLWKRVCQAAHDWLAVLNR